MVIIMAKQTQKKSKNKQHKKTVHKKQTKQKKRKGMFDPGAAIHFLSFVDDKDLAKLAITSKRNIGVAAINELKKRMPDIERIALALEKKENKVLSQQINNMIEFDNIIDITSKQQDSYFQELLYDSLPSMDNNNSDLEFVEDHPLYYEIRDRVIMNHFIRLDNNKKYFIYNPRITKEEITSKDETNIGILIRKYLLKPNTKIYKFEKEYYNGYEGGFYNINQKQIIQDLKKMV